MNVLMISLDKQLLEQKQGDSYERHLAYAQGVTSLTVLVYGSGKERSQGNLRIIPTGGLKILWPLFGLWKGLSLAKHKDLIVCQDPSLTGFLGYILSRIQKCALGVNIHGDFFSKEWKEEYFMNSFLSVVNSFVLKRASGIRTVSSKVQTKVVALTGKKVEVIPTPSHFELFLKKSGHPGISEPYFLFVGRLEKVKNIDFMIKGFTSFRKKHPSFHLAIIGEGSLMGSFGRHEHVHFLGQKQYESLPAFMEHAHALLLCSTNESLGKTIIEGGFAGRPAVASKTSGAREIIEDKKTGLLFEVGDMDGYINCLEKISVVSFANSLGKEARKDYVSRFDSSRNVKKIISFWKGCVNTDENNS